jgi:hypothetical protein
LPSSPSRHCFLSYLRHSSYCSTQQ